MRHIMDNSLGGPSIVLALVLAETAIGGMAVLWLTPAWGKVRPGFYKLVGIVLAVCGFFAWQSGRESLNAAGGSAETGALLLGIFAALAIAFQVLLWIPATRAASRWVGTASVPVGVAALVAIASHPDSAVNPIAGSFQLLAGGLFIGAVIDGLLLGHWHLVDRKLGREPIARMNQIFLAGCALAAIAAVMGGSGGGAARADLSPLLGAGALAVFIAVGLTALCALIGVFIRALIKENSIQAATGLFYLGVLMAFAAEFAAKVRFF